MSTSADRVAAEPGRPPRAVALCEQLQPAGDPFPTDRGAVRLEGIPCRSIGALRGSRVVVGSQGQEQPWVS